MRIKHGSIVPILIQLFAFSAIVGAVSPTVSAAQNDANTTTSNPDFLALQAKEDVGFDWFDGADDFEPEFVLGEVLVKFRTSISAGLTSGIVTTDIASVDKLNKRFEATGIKRMFSNVYKITLPTDADVLSVAREYEADPNVEYAEPNIIYHYFVVPNDADYTQQWAHQMIESEYAWNATTGDPSVVIAIVDSGVDWDHPDLAANIWNNIDEIPNNGLDDDNNGYVDDARGWDFHCNDNNPTDECDHGTHCAGIAAAVTNNSEGVAGVSWNSKIMALRVGPGPGINVSAVAPAIIYATDNGANIISMSFGGYTRSAAVYDAIKYAYDRDVLLVAAAGNVRSPLKPYPAGHEEVVAVAATDQDDKPADWGVEHGVDVGSAFGEWIELASPGDEIYSTVPWGYTNHSGTSMAAPHVAGVAALIWSQFPDMTRDQVQVQLRRTAVDKGDLGFDIYFGYGRINASGAVNQDMPDHDLLVLSWKLPFASEPSDTVTVNTTVLNFGRRTERNVNVKLLVNGIEMDVKEITILKSGESAAVSCLWAPTAEGKYNVTTYVEPKKHEYDKENNAQSAYTYVRYGEAVRVPTDFTTIKEAVNTTNLGIYYGDATIWVALGTYCENDLLMQNSWMSLTLMGENRSTSIIDSAGQGDASVWIHADNVAITGLTIQNISDTGILLLDANNSTISDNTIMAGPNYAEYGIYVDSTVSNCIIANNTISKDSAYYGATYGIHLLYSSGQLISNNDILYSIYGIYLVSSSSNAISDNTISNSGSMGIYMLLESDKNAISDNIITDNNRYGVKFSGSNNTIVRNTIRNNDKGISLLSSSNVIYHNNLIDNTEQIEPMNPGNNTWDDGEGRGNYWSDYTGVDSDHDGIGDDPYVIDSDNTDNYPLMHPWGSIRNVDTDKIYLTIQKAIDASETLDGHTIEVKADTYYEEVCVNKSLTIIGEDPSTTIIDSGSYGDTGFLVYANDTTITGFTVMRYTKCIDLWGSNCNVNGNAFENYKYAIYVEESSSNNIISNNDMSTWGGSYGIYLDFSDSNTISGNLVTHKFIGVYMRCSDQNTITDNTFSYCTIGPISAHSGMYLLQSNNNAISGNTITNNEDYGIFLNDANGNTVSNNTISDNESTGILVGGDDNTIKDNTISNNRYPGMYISWGSFNTVSGNTISNNDCGILLDDYNNTIVENTIQNNGEGIYVSSSSDNNIIHHNNFINNTVQAYSTGLDNTWISTNHVGNYWSDYNGTDENPYYGIGDTPYVIDEDDQDDYPLMWKWFPGDLDGDGYVDSNDEAIFSAAYGSQMGDPNYNPIADLDYDCDVDEDDLAIFEQNYPYP